MDKSDMKNETKENPFSKTVHLPRTQFPMKADLSKREKHQIGVWASGNILQKMNGKKGLHGKFTLHDGPPYANGNFHVGHALNKILKDRKSVV